MLRSRLIKFNVKLTTFVHLCHNASQQFVNSSILGWLITVCLYDII